MDKTIFEFRGWFEGYPVDMIQSRYVIAETSHEAWQKIEKYGDELDEKGMARFVPMGEPKVEIEYVID